MIAWSVFRTLLLALASFGYLANGAQAHLSVSQGETLDLMMCGTGSAKTIALEIPGDPIEETEDTCCGDCAPAQAITVRAPSLVPTFAIFVVPVPTNLPHAVFPRSPLWPGAPPQGPPHTHKA